MFEGNYYRLGIDEVGRGALAGPVTVAGVLSKSDFPEQTFYYNKVDFQKTVDKLLISNAFLDSEFLDTLQIVRDSKKLNLSKRHQISALIRQNPGIFASIILSASNQLIDKFGIGVCLSHLVSLVILKRSLSQNQTQIIIDGQIKILPVLNPELCSLLIIENALETNSFEAWPGFYSIQRQYIHRENYGDDKYLNVALASNLAKVYRDDLMISLGFNYPEYFWESNKGYGTAKHRQAILLNHDNWLLRKSFLGKILEVR